MARSFASYLTNDVPLSAEETGTGFGIIFLVIIFLPSAVSLMSMFLKLLTKSSFFDNIIEWCTELHTLGIIERICASTIKYLSSDDGRRLATEIPKDQSLYRINEKLITTRNASRIRYSGFVLFPFQGLIISIVILDKLFILQQSVETCETYQQIFANNSIYDKGCSLRSKFASGIPASEFFNPLNAFRSSTLPPLMTNISGYCQNSSALQNETVSSDYDIRCMKYFFKWSNIIDTLTNAIQWHQITAFIFKTFLYLTLKWQSTLGHTQWWSRISISRRVTVLTLLTMIWAAIFVIYLLIMIAFFKTLLSTELIIPVQMGVVLLVPLFFIPFPLFNALTVLHWTICTIWKKDCEQESLDTLDVYRNVLIYAKEDEHQ